MFGGIASATILAGSVLGAGQALAATTQPQAAVVHTVKTDDAGKPAHKRGRAGRHHHKATHKQGTHKGKGHGKGKGKGHGKGKGQKGGMGKGSGAGAGGMSIGILGSGGISGSVGTGGLGVSGLGSLTGGLGNAAGNAASGATGALGSAVGGLGSAAGAATGAANNATGAASGATGAGVCAPSTVKPGDFIGGAFTAAGQAVCDVTGVLGLNGH